MSKIKIGGLYKHIKGKLYKVIGVGKHSETLEELVFYEKLDDNTFWARPKKMFLQKIQRDGKRIDRFKLIDSATKFRQY